MALRGRLFFGRGLGEFVVHHRLLADAGVIDEELVNLLAVGRADVRTGLVHHALDVARPFVGQRIVRVDRAAQLVALRAFLGEHS